MNLAELRDFAVAVRDCPITTGRRNIGCIDTRVLPFPNDPRPEVPIAMQRPGRFDY